MGPRRVVQSGGDGKGFFYLAVVVLHDQHLGSVQDAHRATVYGGSGIVGVPAMAASLRQDNLDAFVVHVVVDGACGVAATADAGHEVVRIVASGLFLQLPLYFLRDDALHACHEVGVGVGPHGGTYDVESVGGMAAPVAYGLAAGVGEGHVAGAYRVYLGAQHLHALYVGVLTLDIGGTHEYLALHAHQGAYGGGGHAVLAGTGLGNDARLAHLLGQQNLTDGVVDFVCSGVVEVFTLQIQLATVLLAHAPGVIQGRGAPYVVTKQGVILFFEVVRLNDGKVLLLQVPYRSVENLGDVGPAEFSVITVLVYLIVHACIWCCICSVKEKGPVAIRRALLFFCQHSGMASYPRDLVNLESPPPDVVRSFHAFV